MRNVRIQGWIRTRRDSKPASHLGVHDGSCFAPLQIIADGQLDNYQDEVKLTTGCCGGPWHRNGFQGGGQQYELLANELRVVGWVMTLRPIQSVPSAVWNFCPAYDREVI